MILKASMIFKWFRRRPWAICWKISCEKRVVHVRWTCVLFNHSELPAFVTQLPSVPIQDGDLRLAFEEMRPSRQLQSHLYSQGRANGERPFKWVPSWYEENPNSYTKPHRPWYWGNVCHHLGRQRIRDRRRFDSTLGSMQSSKGRKKTTKRIGTGYMMVKRLSKTSKTLIGKKKKIKPALPPHFFSAMFP